MTIHLTIAEAARRYSVSERTIRRRISTGDLAAVWSGRRLIRIPEEALIRTFRPVPTVTTHAKMAA